ATPTTAFSGLRATGNRARPGASQGLAGVHRGQPGHGVGVGRSGRGGLALASPPHRPKVQVQSSRRVPGSLYAQARARPRASARWACPLVRPYGRTAAGAAELRSATSVRSPQCCRLEAGAKLTPGVDPLELAALRVVIGEQAPELLPDVATDA